MIKTNQTSKSKFDVVVVNKTISYILSIIKKFLKLSYLPKVYVMPKGLSPRS